MSCGKPHKTDCSQVLAEVWRLLDGECSGDERRKLEQHLDECGPCLEQYGLEEHLKELLARKCGGDHAPDTLKAKLRASIRQVVVDTDGAVAVETSVRITEERH
ncbi:MAG TPA: mycothiol system anti-sigma-R factor [Pseudonocardiaceae bacterium]|nr:mycothiol system anti-sigma-R factor [Pseudonocardiaceae bacterium]